LRGLNPVPYTILAFEELEEKIRDPEFLQSHGSQGVKVEFEEGTHRSIVVKVALANATEPQLVPKKWWRTAISFIEGEWVNEW
jgi:hypothetical protein